MPTGCTELEYSDKRRLVAFSLGQSDPEMEGHVSTCSACRSEVEHYTTLLASMRAALADRESEVRIVNCRSIELPGGEHHCVAEDVDHNLVIVMAPKNGTLRGQIFGCSDLCDCWHGAVVRLFGSQGFVATSPVDALGTFWFNSLQPGQRYTVGLVLTEADGPYLRIIGEVRS